VPRRRLIPPPDRHAHRPFRASPSASARSRRLPCRLARRGSKSNAYRGREQQSPARCERPSILRSRNGRRSPCRAGLGFVWGGKARAQKEKTPGSPKCLDLVGIKHRVAIIQAWKSSASEMLPMHPSCVQRQERKYFPLCRSLHAHKTTHDQTKVEPVIESRGRPSCGVPVRQEPRCQRTRATKPIRLKQPSEKIKESGPFFRGKITRQRSVTLLLWNVSCFAQGLCITLDIPLMKTPTVT